MRRFLLFAALLSTWAAGAATISSTTCPGTGCSVSLVADTTALSIQVTGTWSGSIAVELSNDNVTFVPARVFPVGGGFYTSTFTANGGWTMPTGGMAYFRVRATSWTSGTATVTTRPTPSTVADFGALGVTVSLPDGGLPVNLGSATVNTAVTTPDGGLPVTLGAQRVAVEATGPGGDPVTITGTTVSTLAPSTITALGPDTCTPYSRPWQTISPTAASAVPPNLPDGGSGGLEGRTHLFIANADSVNSVACGPMQSDGGTPQWGVIGTPLFPGGGSNTWQVKSNVVIYCRAKTGTAVQVTPEEAICAKVQ